MGPAVECMMTPKPIAFIDQQAISIGDMGDLLVKIGETIDRGAGFTLFTLNLDHLVKRRQDRNFWDLYARATFVTADGWPIVSLARSQAPGLARTAGADLVVPLCRLSAVRGVPIALFGSSAPILTNAAARLRALFPGLQIAYCKAPPDGFDPSGRIGRDAMQEIAASGAKICFVALGAPKQEIFSDLAFASNADVGFVCIGAALDFIAGARRRAPRVVQKVRLEWAWRLAHQPRRLGLRYLRCALLFGLLLVRGGRSDPLAATRCES